MSTPSDALTLAHWRRTVAELYAALRAGQSRDPVAAAAAFRTSRDALFGTHPDSPVPPDRRSRWLGADWFPYDPRWRIEAVFEAATVVTTFDIPLAADGLLRCARIGTVRFTFEDTPTRLALYWLAGYGGGLWLPFGDTTNRTTTYGGGRYLYDTIKGADLGAAATPFVLDFNFAYNPSCAYDDRWSCPLSPLENRLPFAVPAGERLPPP